MNKKIIPFTLLFFSSAFSYAKERVRTSSLPSQTPRMPDGDGTVAGGSSQGVQLRCKAYLYVPEDKPFRPKKDNYPLYFFQQGSGHYSFGFPQLKGMIDKQWFNFDGNEYILTMDKPGITYDPTNEEDFSKVDRNIFKYYTPENLAECAKNALIWANGYLQNPKRNIVVWGHSEGSLVMTRLADYIFSAPQSDPNLYSLQSQFKGLFLSGVTIDDVPTVSKYQFKYPSETYDTFMKNYNAGYSQETDDYFYNEAYHSGYYWVEYMMNINNPIAGGVHSMFDQLAATDKGKTLPIEIFHGLNDTALNPQSVLNYEAKNNAKPTDQQLNIRARYYNGPHNPTDKQQWDMGLVFRNDAK